MSSRTQPPPRRELLPETAVAKSKGNGFTSSVRTLRELVTPAEFDRLLAALSHETAELIRRPPLPIAWIAAYHFGELVEAAARILFDGDEALVSEWSRRALLQDLRTSYKLFIRLMSPHYVISRATHLWRTYTLDNGIVRAEPIEGCACEVVYENIATPNLSKAFWAYQRGALRGVTEATGVKKVTVAQLEGGGSSSGARFVVRWE